MGFHGGVINAEELICGGRHVDLIGLSLSAFLIHELIDGLVWRGVLEKHAHDEEKGSAQSRRTALGDAPAANINSPGLIRRRVNARIGHESGFGMKTADIANLRHKLGAKARANANTSA